MENKTRPVIALLPGKIIVIIAVLYHHASRTAAVRRDKRLFLLLRLNPGHGHAVFCQITTTPTAGIIIINECDVKIRF